MEASPMCCASIVLACASDTLTLTTSVCRKSARQILYAVAVAFSVSLTGVSAQTFSADADARKVDDELSQRFGMVAASAKIFAEKLAVGDCAPESDRLFVDQIEQLNNIRTFGIRHGDRVRREIKLASASAFFLIGDAALSGAKCLGTAETYYRKVIQLPSSDPLSDPYLFRAKIGIDRVFESVKRELELRPLQTSPTREGNLPDWVPSGPSTSSAAPNGRVQSDRSKEPGYVPNEAEIDRAAKTHSGIMPESEMKAGLCAFYGTCR
jgi:hypothetical protein